MTARTDLHVRRAKEIAAVAQYVDELIDRQNRLVIELKQGAGEVTIETQFNRGLVAHIGDDLALGAGETLVRTLYTASGWAGVDWYAAFGKQVNNPDATGKATVQNIADFRANGKGEPDLWVIDLATNTTGEATGSVETMRAAVRAVCAEIDKGGAKPIMWVNLGTQYSYPHAFHQAVNTMLGDEMAARGRNGKVADWWAWNKANRPDANATNSWFTDGKHMTSAGYQARYGFITGQADSYVKTLSTATTTTPTDAEATYLGLASQIIY